MTSEINKADLYRKIDGPLGVQRITKKIVTKLFADDLLKDFFKNSKPERIVKMHSQLIQGALIGDSYTGAQLKAVHCKVREMGVGKKHFVRFKEIIEEVAVGEKFTTDEAKVLSAYIDSKEKDVLGN